MNATRSSALVPESVRYRSLDGGTMFLSRM